MRSCHNSIQNKRDDEVYAGLPTFHNTLPLFEALGKCVPSLGSIDRDKLAGLPIRKLFSRLELVAILASVYELVGFLFTKFASCK